ncbi:hypothetical protein [Calothrix sp. NIES-2098]|uniref:hypothetical protein n=1 Tax=Calothrix sp. NIES-2098 TaxID=1954171 RepID=UPI000B618C7C|nr:hypothetical protein NIES2098_39040 [Calothrix sp. NIES-2098]
MFNDTERYIPSEEQYLEAFHSIYQGLTLGHKAILNKLYQHCYFMKDNRRLRTWELSQAAGYDDDSPGQIGLLGKKFCKFFGLEHEEVGQQALAIISWFPEEINNHWYIELIPEAARAFKRFRRETFQSNKGANMSDVLQVSPRFQLNCKTWKITGTEPNEGPFNFDDKTAARLIYKDRTQGWFFEPALKLIENDQTVVAVHIVTPLIKSLENYIQGKSSHGQSSTFFKNRAKAIFSFLDDNAINLLYQGVRCGFAHQGFLKDDNKRYNIIISSEKSDIPIKYNHPVMTIYTHKYITEIQNEFEKYYAQLENNEEKLNSFFLVWKNQWDIKKTTAIEISGII